MLFGMLLFCKGGVLLFIVEYFQSAYNGWVFIRLFFDCDIEFVKGRLFDLRSCGFSRPLRIIDTERNVLFTLD